jgi:hypothetical protein
MNELIAPPIRERPDEILRSVDERSRGSAPDFMIWIAAHRYEIRANRILGRVFPDRNGTAVGYRLRCGAIIKGDLAIERAQGFLVD